MERLTQRLEPRTGEVLMASEYEEKYTEQEWISTLQDRLAAYEDTRLTPERCAEFARADAEGRYIVMRDAEQEGVARLRELAEADKEGRLVVLPCQVGTATYYIRYPIAVYPDESEPEIKRGIFTLCDLDRVGHSVFFLTLEEAEKALEAMKK